MLPRQRPFLLLLAILVLVAMVAVVSYMYAKRRIHQGNTVQINVVGEKAFGSLAQTTQGVDSELSGAAPRSADAGLNASSTLVAPAPTGLPDSKLIPAPYTSLTYKYVGAAINQPDQKVQVLRRLGGTAPKGMGDLLHSSGLDLMSGTSLTSGSIQSTSFTLDDYRVDVDFVSGHISMYRTDSLGKAVPMVAQIPIRILGGSALSDSDTLAVAANFISKYGITTASYGSPVVERPVGFTASDTYSQLSVVYPLVVSNRPVYSSDGAVAGLRLAIDTSTKSVISLDNLTTSSYEASLYDAETDSAVLIAIATSGFAGSIQAYSSSEPNGTGSNPQVEVAELGDPQLCYQLFTQYDTSTSTSHDVLVPALAFPVSKGVINDAPDRVVVPLTKELLTNGTGEIPPTAGVGSGGSAGASTGTVEGTTVPVVK